MPPIEGIAVAVAVISLLLCLYFFFTWREVQQECDDQVAQWTRRYRQSNDLCHDEMEGLNNRNEITIHALQSERENNQAQVARLIGTIDKLEGDLARGTDRYNQQQLWDWFGSLPSAQYQNRLEVNTRFVYRFLQFLGYPDAALRQDVPADIQADTINVRGHLDWLVHNMNGINTLTLGKACLAVRTLEPGSLIDELIVSQVRSCAFAEDVPLFVVTDGTRIEVYATKVKQQRAVMETSIDRLEFDWNDFVDELGFGNIVDDE